MAAFLTSGCGSDMALASGATATSGPAAREGHGITGPGFPQHVENRAADDGIGADQTAAQLLPQCLISGGIIGAEHRGQLAQPGGGGVPHGAVAVADRQGERQPDSGRRGLGEDGDRGAADPRVLVAEIRLELRYRWLCLGQSE